MPFSEEDIAAREKTLREHQERDEKLHQEMVEEAEFLEQHFPEVNLQTAKYLWHIARLLTIELKRRFREGESTLRDFTDEDASMFVAHTWDGRWHSRFKDAGTLLTAMARLYDDIDQTLAPESLGRSTVRIRATAPLPIPARP